MTRTSGAVSRATQRPPKSALKAARKGSERQAAARRTPRYPPARRPRRRAARAGSGSARPASESSNGWAGAAHRASQARAGWPKATGRHGASESPSRVRVAVARPGVESSSGPSRQPSEPGRPLAALAALTAAATGTAGRAGFPTGRAAHLRRLPPLEPARSWSPGARRRAPAAPLGSPHRLHTTAQTRRPRDRHAGKGPRNRRQRPGRPWGREPDHRDHRKGGLPPF